MNKYDNLIIKIFYDSDEEYIESRLFWYALPALIILNTIYYIAY